MSRAYEEYTENDDIAIQIAVEVGLLTNCAYEVHSHIYYNPGDYDFTDVEIKIKNEFAKYDMSKERERDIFKSIKGLSEIHQDTCYECEKA